MLTKEQYGQARPDGTRTKPERSAINGKPLEPGDTLIHIGRYVVGVKAREWRRMSEAEKQVMRAEWARELPADAYDTAGAPEPVDYDALTFADAKALATERGVDIEGRRSRELVIQALQADDIRRRLNPTAQNTAEAAPEPAQED